MDCSQICVILGYKNQCCNSFLERFVGQRWAWKCTLELKASLRSILRTCLKKQEKRERSGEEEKRGTILRQPNVNTAIKTKVICNLILIQEFLYSQVFLKVCMHWKTSPCELFAHHTLIISCFLIMLSHQFGKIWPTFLTVVY